MAVEWALADLNDLVERYAAGEGLMRLARHFGRASSTVRNALIRRGVQIRDSRAGLMALSPTERSQIRANGTVTNRALGRSWQPPDLATLIEQYRSGVSMLQLSTTHGVSRAVIERVLRENDVPIRGPRAANQIVAANKTPEQHLACSMAGRAGVAGRPRPEHLIEQRARTNERRAKLVGPYERLLVQWLDGLEIKPQKAAGRYNIDFAIGPIAVEVFGGHRHSHGRHAQRHARRTKYLLDQGWFVIFIWATSARFTPVVAEYVRAQLDLTRRDPTLWGQYRVVWGDGQDVTALCPQFHEFPRVPPFVGSLDWRASDSDPGGEAIGM